MVTTRALTCFAVVVSCSLLFATGQAQAQQPTSQTAWFEADHTGAAPRSFQIQANAVEFQNRDILSQRFTRGQLGDSWFPVTGVTVTLRVQGGGQQADFPVLTDSSGQGYWRVTGLPLNIQTFSCTLIYNGGDVRNGVVLSGANAFFTVSRTNW